ncbi:MAG: hypothetical protein HAW67_04140 [Endozoicomonadaceae bacterium]|nr:hypothetical protein [Endozoicomonadaceae bacterium]
MNTIDTSGATDVAVQDESMIIIAVTTWQLQKKLNKAMSDIQEDTDHYEKMNNSILRLLDQLSTLGFTINSREKQKYNDGMNIDVMLRKGNSKLKNEYIKETIEPEILLKGKIVKKERVIIEYGK